MPQAPSSSTPSSAGNGRGDGTEHIGPLPIDAVRAYIEGKPNTWLVAAGFNFALELRTVVNFMHWVAHPVPAGAPAPAAGAVGSNRWTLFLQTADARSIELDVTANAGPNAFVLFPIRPYGFLAPNNTRITMQPVNDETTVGDIFAVLIAHHRDDYTFVGGRGSRFWYDTFASDLEQAGIISQENATRVHQALQFFYPNGGAPPVAKPVVPGTFV